MSFTSIDQLNNEITFDEYPSRIISLVPSQSELLYDLGIGEKLVGITKFCIHPKEMFESVQRIGGTKNLDIDAIKKLNPDLIIGNKEENTQSDIEELKKHFKVWMSDVNTLEDAYQMIDEIGRIVNKKEKAQNILHQINFSGFKNNKKVIYLIWNNPLMAAGKNTFIDSMITAAGFENIIQENRYPEISIESIRELNPDYLFLSTEPFPFKQNHCLEFQSQLPGSKVMLVDGEMFSWYGSRLIQSKKYFEELQRIIE